MTKFQEFMNRYRLTQYRLHRLSGFSKSQISEWQRGLHRPTRKSAIRLALAMGLPAAGVMDQIETRECYQNDIAPDGKFVPRQKKNRPALLETNDAIRTDAVYCLTCRRMMSIAA